MGNCTNCGSCGGCGKILELTEIELSLLGLLAQYSFLPVAKRTGDGSPVFLECDQYTPEEYSLAILCLEKKSLILISYDRPLSGANLEAYADCKFLGSMGLTARGQQILDLLDTQGIES